MLWEFCSRRIALQPKYAAEFVPVPSSGNLVWNQPCMVRETALPRGIVLTRLSIGLVRICEIVSDCGQLTPSSPKSTDLEGFRLEPHTNCLRTGTLSHCFTQSEGNFDLSIGSLRSLVMPPSLFRAASWYYPTASPPTLVLRILNLRTSKSKPTLAPEQECSGALPISVTEEM
jgi:hypothetical protein